MSAPLGVPKMQMAVDYRESRRAGGHIVQPPSITCRAPVVNADSSLAR